MALFSTPAEHAANPPGTWQVVKAGQDRWALTTCNGFVIDTFPRKSDADTATTTGFIVDLYVKEGRWYAGEQVDNWKPYEMGVSDRLGDPQ